MNSFRCMICDYIHNGDSPPESCFICGASAKDFEPFTEKNITPQEHPTFWRCLPCEYIHEGSQAPAVCPVCGVKKEHFETYSSSEDSEAQYTKDTEP